MPSRDFPGTIEAAADAEVWLRRETGALGLAGDTAYAINLCVEELFLNAVKHGRANRATISIWTEADGARLEFVDDGQAFDPTVAPVKRLRGTGTDFEIGGFGSGLVRKFSRRMTYHRTRGANRLTLEFNSRPESSGGECAPPDERSIGAARDHPIVERILWPPRRRPQLSDRSRRAQKLWAGRRDHGAGRGGARRGADPQRRGYGLYG